MQRSAAQHSAAHCSSVQCSAAWSKAMQWGKVCWVVWQSVMGQAARPITKPPLLPIRVGTTVARLQWEGEGRTGTGWWGTGWGTIAHTSQLLIMATGFAWHQEDMKSSLKGTGRGCPIDVKLVSDFDAMSEHHKLGLNKYRNILG